MRKGPEGELNAQAPGQGLQSSPWGLLKTSPLSGPTRSVLPGPRTYSMPCTQRGTWSSEGPRRPAQPNEEQMVSVGPAIPCGVLSSVVNSTPLSSTPRTYKLPAEQPLSTR